MGTGVINKHLVMQTSSNNISERMGCSQELTEFQHGTVIGATCATRPVVKCPRYHYKVKTIGKGKQLATGTPRNMTELGWQMQRQYCAFYWINHYRTPIFMWPSDQLKISVYSALWNGFPWPRSQQDVQVQDMNALLTWTTTQYCDTNRRSAIETLNPVQSTVCGLNSLWRVI